MRATLLILATTALTLCACKRQPPAGQSTSAATSAAHSSAPETPVPGSPASPKPADSTPAPAATQETQDKAAARSAHAMADTDVALTLGQDTFHFVKHVYHCPGPSKEITVDWWELHDSSGKVLYREEYKTDEKCDETTDVGAQALNGQQGHGILIDGEDLPSAPESGGWVQVFGIQNGKLVPFGKPFSGGSEFAGFTTQSKSGRSVGGGMVTTIKDVLTFKEWTGNFHIIYAMGIDWISGTVSPAWHCLSRNSKGIMVDGCSCPVEATAQPRQQMTFVRLYREPDAGSSPKHVVVKPDSKLEFLEAAEPVPWQGLPTTPTPVTDSPGDVWLKIRVDGQEGWIHEQEDFEAVGLPFSG